MLYDADRDDLSALTKMGFDVCILGAGVAGIILAVTLANRGQKVVLLEGGGLDYSDLSQDLYEGIVVDGDDSDTVTGRLRYFGGTSGHWAGHCMQLDAWDFERKTYIRASSWPIGPEALSPYASTVRQWLEVGAEIGAAYPFQDVEQTDFQFIRKPVSTTIDPDFEGEPTRFGSKYRREVLEHPNIALIVHANALSLHYAADGQAISGVSCISLSGDTRFSVSGAVTIVCLGGLETPRFLLNSNELTGAKTGNDSDLVGRYFGWHPSLKIGNFILDWEHLKEHQPKIADWATATEHQVAYFTPSQDFMQATETLNFLMHVSMLEEPSDSVDRSFQDRLKAMLCSTETMAGVAEALYGEIWQCDNHRYDGEVYFLFEQEPLNGSRVRLAEEKDRFGSAKLKVDARLSETDARTVRSAALRLGEMFATNHIGRLHLEDGIADDHERWFPEQSLGLDGIWHAMGTCRMANHQSDGVVDTDLRVFNTPNLYICGSSTFPTFGHANPTFTIAQLALRLADHLTETGTGQNRTSPKTAKAQL